MFTQKSLLCSRHAKTAPKLSFLSKVGTVLQKIIFFNNISIPNSLEKAMGEFLENTNFGD